MRQIELEVERESAEQKAQQAEVLRDVDIGSGKSAEEIQREILDSYAAHGYDPPSDFSRVSRFISAGTGRRGTRTGRLAYETGTGLRAAWKWTRSLLEEDSKRQHPPDDKYPPEPDGG
jgi:hypothetical protein